jgi:hypothetical protein
MLATYGLMLVLSAGAEGGDDVKIEVGAQVRPRVEAVATGGNYIGVKTAPGSDRARGRLSYTQRSRVNVKASGSDFAAKVSVQDVRAWGAAGTLCCGPGSSSAGTVDFHEAFVEIGEKMKLKVGRQEIAIDGHRLVGTVNWTQRARSFDAIRFDTAAGANGKFTAFWSRVPDGFIHDVFALNYVHTMENLKISVPVIIQTDSQVEADKRNYPLDDNFTRFTGGVYAKGSSDKIKYRAEFYYQGGSVSEDVSIGAFMGGVRVGYAASEVLNPTLWIDYLSGDDGSDAESVKSFDTLFATNHKFYGYMDRFLNVPVHTSGRGLIDIALKNDAKVGPGKLHTAAHYFMYATAPDGSDLSNAVGAEIDVVYAMPVAKKVKLVVGASGFIHMGDSIDEDVVGAGNEIGKSFEEWVFAMLDFNI